MKLLFTGATILLSSGLACFGETMDGHLIPSWCKNEDPKTHTRDCALRCRLAGFGVLTEGGQYIRFNSAGNTKAVALLRSSKKAADLRVSVQGTRNGAVLDVESIDWK